jgi:hypothetical protein
LVKIMVSRAIVRFPSTSGASIVKKSSNKCKIRAISYLFSAIQHIAFENQYQLFCIKWCDAYHFNTKLAFGYRPSPKKMLMNFQKRHVG